MEKSLRNIILISAFAVAAASAAGEYLAAQNGFFVLFSFMAQSLVIFICAAFAAREGKIEPMACGVIGAFIGLEAAFSEPLSRWALVYFGIAPYVAPGGALSIHDASAIFMRDAAAAIPFWVFSGIVLGLAAGFLAQRFSKKE